MNALSPGTRIEFRSVANGQRVFRGKLLRLLQHGRCEVQVDGEKRPRFVSEGRLRVVSSTSTPWPGPGSEIA